MTRGRRITLRARLLITVLAALALVLAALTAGFNLVLAARLSADAAGLVNARAQSQLAALRVDHGRIVLPEAPDQNSPDASVWVFQGRRPIEVPQAPPVPLAAVLRVATTAPAGRDFSRPPLRLRGLPVVQAGQRIGAVVAAASLAPYDQTVDTALLASGVLAAMAFLAVGLGGNWLIARALRPVTRMTRQAAAWSDHDLDRRFGLGPPSDEFTELAATLDALLGRLAASLRHEQRLSAELSHELRTPLAGIQAQAQYALRHTPQDDGGQEVLREILTAARRMTATLDTLIAAARAELDPHAASSDLGRGVRAAASAAAALAAERDVEICVAAGADGIRVAVEQHLVERILAPLIENASRFARHEIGIEARASGAHILLRVADDGPGLLADQLEAVFEPGWQAPPPNANVRIANQGAGLGLPLARRLARSAGGEVRAQAQDSGGAFVVQLPTAAR